MPTPSSTIKQKLTKKAVAGKRAVTTRLKGSVKQASPANGVAKSKWALGGRAMQNNVATAGYPAKLSGSARYKDSVATFVAAQLAAQERHPQPFVKVFHDVTRGLEPTVRQKIARNLWESMRILAEETGVIDSIVEHTEAEENAKTVVKLVDEGTAARKKLLSSGALLPSVEFQTKLQVTRQAMSKAVAAHRLFHVPGPSGQQLYPAFYSDPRYDRRVLEKVSKQLGTLPGASKWQFFTTPKGSLKGATPLQALIDGKVDDVLKSAAGFAER
jgi:hypothetical protein